MDHPHCAFRKPVMGTGYGCEHASLCHTPMGCSVLCQSPEHYARCNDVLDSLIEAARFALSYTPGTDSFTHGKLMKVQHGGLIGLNKVLNPAADPHHIENICALIAQVSAIDLPLQEILAEMREWQNRRRGKKK